MPMNIPYCHVFKAGDGSGEPDNCQRSNRNPAYVWLLHIYQTPSPNRQHDETPVLHHTAWNKTFPCRPKKPYHLTYCIYCIQCCISTCIPLRNFVRPWKSSKRFAIVAGWLEFTLFNLFIQILETFGNKNNYTLYCASWCMTYTHIYI